MLKKLVKYGNSNALVIDKAILELLNMAEGSVVKISTDGKSLILTPQEGSTSQQVQETYTNDQAFLEVQAQEIAKRYNISEHSQKKLLNLYKRFKELLFQLSENPAYTKGLSLLRQQFSNTDSLEFVEAYRNLRRKCSPELVMIEEALNAFEKPDKKDQVKSMEQAFAAVFKKHAEAYKAYNEFLNNPEYQHEVQLIAEKYQTNKDSAAYMDAIEALQNKYSPETKQLRDEIKAISQKHSTGL